MSSFDVEGFKRRVDEAFKKIEDEVNELERRIESGEYRPFRWAMRELRDLVRGFRGALNELTEELRKAKEGSDEGGDVRNTLKELEDYIEKRAYSLKDRIMDLADKIRARYGLESIIPIRVFENIGKTVAKVIEESLETLEQAVGRVSTTVLSVRISDEDLRIIDSLVEGGVFRSRSEAVAFFTHRGIECSKDWIEKVKDKLEEIRKLQREIRSEIDSQFNRKSS
jgi:Arc/MetJ-type ribon-helix-helix transcriptional regulator